MSIQKFRWSLPLVGECMILHGQQDLILKLALAIPQQAQGIQHDKDGTAFMEDD